LAAPAARQSHRWQFRFPPQFFRRWSYLWCLSRSPCGGGGGNDVENRRQIRSVPIEKLLNGADLYARAKAAPSLGRAGFSGSAKHGIGWFM
jgi:hypothetical protein